MKTVSTITLTIFLTLAATLTCSAKTCQEYVVETRNGQHHYVYRWVDC